MKDSAIRGLLIALQLLLCGIASYGVSVIGDMSKSINTLNVQIATVISERSTDREDLRELKARVRALEIGEK